MSTSVSTPTSTHYEGVYAARVYNNRDPSSQGRVQLYIPQIFGSTPVPIWAPPLVNSQSLPPVGSMVWCIFQGGDPAFPAYLGSPNEIPDAGLPQGGTVGQVLTKNSAANYAASWQTPFAGLSGGRAQLGAVTVTNSGGWAEIHANVRMTVTVGPSGVVDVFYQAQDVYASAGIDCTIGGNVDGGGWNAVAGHGFNAANTVMNIFGVRQWTGLTPGPHTFSMGWAPTGAGTLTISSARGPGAGTATVCFPR